LAGFDPVKISSPIDVLWFRISRREGDPKEALAVRVGSGMFMVFIDRFEYWQVGCTIVKGGYKVVRASGLDRLRRSLARVAPEWADRFDELKEWKQIPVLSVEVSRLKRWHKPGLLLIGDAAHVMSPLGGVGINYAIQDAVVPSNVLGEKLRTEEPIREQDLAEVQRRRGLPIRAIQTFQSLGQKGVTRGVLSAEGERAFTLPRFVLPLLKSPRLLAIPARFLSFGLRPPHVDFSGKKRLVRVGETLVRLTLKEAKAVYDPRVLSAELLDGYIRANLSDRHRRARIRRFLAGQFDPENNRTTMDLLDGLGASITRPCSSGQGRIPTSDPCGESDSIATSPERWVSSSCRRPATC
jgi:hypothetical protein